MAARVYRQRHGEPRAGNVVHGDSTAMACYDIVNDGQSEPRTSGATSTGIVESGKSFEDLLVRSRRYPASVVGDWQQNNRIQLLEFSSRDFAYHLGGHCPEGFPISHSWP